VSPLPIASLLSPLARAATSLTVGGLFLAEVVSHPHRIALQQGEQTWTYANLNDRVNRLAHVLVARGIGRGDRVALLSENRKEYVELELAAAKLGVIVACQNWRQADPELAYCIRLIEPKLAITSERYASTVARIDHGVPLVLELGEEYERALSDASAAEPPELADPEDGLIVFYTSGTTGLPKGALISQRAMVARSAINRIDRPAGWEEGYIAWAPYFHMGSGDMVFTTLLRGSKVIIMDGFDAGALVAAAAREKISWLQVLPGVVDRIIDELRRTGLRPKGVGLVGVMVDLVPRDKIAEITSLLQAPYASTFGSTETGAAPLSKGFVPIGVVPERLSKSQSSLCQLRLVDSDDREVPDGEPGEAIVRGPSLFSGYWGAPEVTATEFRGGWFHMGDVFVRNSNATYDFVDRRKYLIKSGGENIYPAEIERLLLASPRVAEAVVVRRRDPRWGEVPIAFVVARDNDLTAAEVIAMCRGKIASYKLPKQVRFVANADLPRSTTGKVQRHALEQLLNDEEASP